MLIREAVYEIDGRKVRIRVSDESDSVCVMLYSPNGCSLAFDTVLRFDAGDNLTDMVHSAALSVLCDIRGEGSTPMLRYGRKVGMNPADTTASEVGDLVREIERFIP